jgi:hypothetical protein
VRSDFLIGGRRDDIHSSMLRECRDYITLFTFVIYGLQGCKCAANIKCLGGVSAFLTAIPFLLLVRNAAGFIGARNGFFKL